MKYPPQPKGSPVFGNLKAFKKDPINFMLQTAEEEGDVAMFRILNKKIYFLNHPDHIRHVLHTNYKNYHKSPGYKPLRLLGGMGIFTNDGEEWLRRRKLYQPAFSHSAIISYSNCVIDNATEMLNQWERKIEKGDSINISEEMTKITMNIISESLFTQRFDYNSDIWHNITYALEWISERALRAPFVFPHTWPTKKNRKFKTAVSSLNQMIYNVIETKKRQNNNPSDLLSRFMDPEDDKLKGFNDQELRDEVMTIFIAGHETSANVLSWAFYLLASHPQIQDKVVEEVIALKKENLDFEDLHHLIYISQVLNETMRLYPPVWHLGRMNLEDDEIGGYHIPKGSHVRMSPLTLHRNKEFWPNPDKFDPDRFSKVNFDHQKPFSHIPFGAGPRLCAGRNFAMMEMVLILAMAVKKYRFEYEGKPVDMAPLMTLRSKGDIFIRVVKR